MNEQTLFDYLKGKYWEDLTQSKDKYSFYDCFSESTKTRIELKCRKRHYPNLLIEKDKYFKLVKRYIEQNEIPLYINSTPEGVYAFDLRVIKPIWTTDKRMPQTTEFDIINKVEKTYALINIEQGKKI